MSKLELPSRAATVAEGVWHDKARNLFASGLLERAIVALEAAREQDPQDVGIGKRLVDVYRAHGDLTSAAALVSQLVQATEADGRIHYLHDLFSGRATSPSDVDEDEVPSPFAIFDDFLPRDVFEHVRKSAVELLPRSSRATVSDKAETETSSLRVDERVRRSSKLPNPTPIAEILRPRLRAVIEAGSARLGLQELSPSHVELELGVYRDGDFFMRHQDLYESVRSRRVVSFVFFCSAIPRPFEGGDLLLYDQQRSRAQSTSLNFTRIEPHPNRLVLFDPSTFHEVTPVHCSSNLPGDLRYTVTGWVHETVKA